jgi:PmbA protein
VSRGDGERVGGHPRICQDLADRMLTLALRAGAEDAEVLVRDGAELRVKVRKGEPELVKEAGSRGLGLRAIKDGRAAVTYTSDFTPQAMQSFAEESVALCRLAEPDALAALPEREEMARTLPDLDLWDDAVLGLDVADAITRAKAG